jgi:hypothetical protein
MNDFLLKRAQQSSDLARLTTTVANYTSGYSFFYRISHLKGEEVLGFAKWFNDYPFGVDNDSHHLIVWIFPIHE